MKISVTRAGKRYNREWIFRSLELELNSGKHWAITGHNGSGKSTLLQCIAGSMYLNEGTISYHIGNLPIEPEDRFKHISICAPYLEVIEEMTALEFLTYHSSFKPFKPGWTSSMILEEIGLTKATNKQIRYFSSGMKQRIKLAQALLLKYCCLMSPAPTSTKPESTCINALLTPSAKTALCSSAAMTQRSTPHAVEKSAWVCKTGD
jgi:ABC-type multidrug transport system ATPase subunit